MQETRVLIVDGERTARYRLAEFFASRHAQVWDAESAAQAWDVLRQRPVDLVVAVGDATRGEGKPLVADVKKLDDRIEVVAIVDTPERGHGALAEGAYVFFLEPVDFERLGAVLRHIAETAELRERSDVLGQLVEGTARLGNLVTRDPRVIRLFTTVRRLAPCQAPVLIEGETGAGKESLARALHDLGGEGRGFVALDGATLSSQDLERAYAEARDGTLFVNDVLALAPEVAATFVTLLDRRGASGEARARVIAASREDVGQRARQGTSAGDLHVRFAGTVLKIPPLRERPGDVPVIAEEILRAFAGPDQAPPRLTRDAEEALQAHGWTGNVDELRSVLESAVAPAGGGQIDLSDLPPAFRNRQAAAERPAQGESRPLRDIEVEHLKKVLSETRGNKARAARILGLSRWALQRKLQKHGISLDEVMSQARHAS